MIETIFYFANSKTEYDANANSGNISARTISFVPTGNGVGDIYKNGIKYGCGISESTINEIINNLPFASTTQAGIIKLGKGLKSVGNDGTVDVDFTGLNGTDGINGLDGLVENILKTIIDKNGTGVVVTPRSLSGSTVAIADIKVGDDTKTIYAPTGSGEGRDYAITNFGKSGTSLTISQNNNTAKSVDIKDVVKSSIQNLIDNGDTIVNNFGQKTQVLVDPTLTSGTQIATITVDGTSKTLYAPAGSGSGGGNNGPTDEEVDEKINQAKQDLQEEIDAARDIANEEKQRLTNLINTLDSEIQTKFENMLEDVSWMQEHWPEGSGSTSNFGLQDVEEYLQTIGVWDENEDHTKSNAKWSKITQKVDTIELAVNALNSDGNITEALQSSINLAVQDGVASLNLETMYAKKDDTEKIVEWLTSGFRSATSSEMTYNEIVSAARNGNHSAISNLYSKVEEIDGAYVAESGVESMVDDAITGLVNNTNGKYSESQLYSAIGENAENIAAVRTYVDDKTSKASIVAAVGDVSGGLVTKATYDSDMTELQSKYDGMQGLVYTYVDGKISQAGLVASSDLEGYVKKALVIASINDSGESNVKIDADKINIAGITIQGSQISDVDEIISNKVTTEYIKGKLGTITVDAENINLNGTTWAELINAEQIVADQLESQNIKTSELEVFGNGTKLSINGTNGILLEGQTSNPYHFDIDGSGQFANGAISWDSFGNISFGSKFISAANANLSVESLVATKTGAGTTTVDGNGFFIEGVQSESAIRSDGSGDLADGAISWDTSGNITLGSKFITAANANLSVNSLKAGSSNVSQIKSDGSGYLGGNAIVWGTDGSGSIANGSITWNSDGDVSSLDLKGSGYTYIGVTDTATNGVSEMFGGELLVYGNGASGTSKLTGNGLRVETVQTSYEYTVSGPEQYSDMRKKDVIEDENISIESIASAPLFKYRPKGFDSAQILIGSSAQYWQDIVPEAVSSDEEGYLKMNYITLNTVASLTSAKEIVKLKEENTALKQRVEALEARLQLIENKLNA